MLIHAATLMLAALGGMVIVLPLVRWVSMILAALSLVLVFRCWNAFGITRPARRLAVIIFVVSSGIIFLAIRTLLTG